MKHTFFTILFYLISLTLLGQSSPQYTFENNLSIDSSQNILISKIQFEGNRRTKDFIIKREMDLNEGDSITFSQLNEQLLLNARRIFNTNLFINVLLKVNALDASKIVIKVIVKENWYVWAFPYAKLNDRNFNEWVERGSDFGRLNYGAFIDHENLFGRMQKLEFVFETGFTNRFTLRYNIPYLGKDRNNGLFTEFKYQTLSNIAINTNENQLDFAYKDFVLKRQFEGKLKFRRRQGFYIFHYVEVGYNSINISDSLQFLNKYYVVNQGLNQQFATLGYTFRYDKRDNINFSLKGRALIVDARKMGFLTNDNFNSWQFRLAFADYYKLSKKWYGNYILKSSVYTNPDIPYSLQRGIGYDENILRGYDLFVVNGSAYVSGRFNLKREIYKNIFNLKFIKQRQFNVVPFHLFINLFSDWGYVYNKFPERMNNNLSNSLLRSFGIGMEINAAYNSTIKFNFSRNGLNQNNFFINFQKDIWTRWN